MWLRVLLARLIEAFTSRTSQHVAERFVEEWRCKETRLRDQLAARIHLSPEAVDLRLARFPDGSIVPYVHLHVVLSNYQQVELHRFLTEMGGTHTNTAPVSGVQ